MPTGSSTRSSTAYTQIRDAALADPVKPFTNDEFEQTVAELIDFARKRPAFVIQEVQRHSRTR